MTKSRPDPPLAPDELVSTGNEREVLVYVHMIEETARHAGHADILREQTDGRVGFDG